MQNSVASSHLFSCSEHAPKSKAQRQLIKRRSAVREGSGISPRYRTVTPQDVSGPMLEEVENIAKGWYWAPSQTAEQLRWDHFTPSKKLGQNFVRQQEVLEKIVRACKIRPGDVVLEIGPGTGNLTTFLLKAGAFVTAIEKDRKLVPLLQESCQGAIDSGQLTIVEDSVLEADIPQLCQTMLKEQEERIKAYVAEQGSAPFGVPDRVKLVANLPYSITTRALHYLLHQGDHISHAYLMLQLEVAQRICSTRVGHQYYRAATVFAQYYTKPELRFIIHRRAYYPQPKVHGALVHFTMKRSYERTQLAGTEASFFNFVSSAFHMTMRPLVGVYSRVHDKTQLLAALDHLSLPSWARARHVTPKAYVALYNLLHEQNEIVDLAAEYVENAHSVDGVVYPSGSPEVPTVSLEKAIERDYAKRRELETAEQKAMRMLKEYKAKLAAGKMGEAPTVGEPEWGTREYWLKAELTPTEEMHLLLLGSMDRETLALRRAHKERKLGPKSVAETRES